MGRSDTGPARRQLPRSPLPAPEHTQVVMEVGEWARGWSGGAEAGPARRQLPSSVHTAPRVVKVGSGTTTTPATIATEFVKRMKTNWCIISAEDINMLPWSGRIVVHKAVINVRSGDHGQISRTLI